MGEFCDRNLSKGKSKYFITIANDFYQYEHPNSPYVEGLMSRNDVLKRERILKGWIRRKNLELIEKTASQER
jgi:predicted GIY-YIG superfamily endonuclease